MPWHNACWQSRFLISSFSHGRKNLHANICRKRGHIHIHMEGMYLIKDLCIFIAEKAWFQSVQFLGDVDAMTI